MSGLTIAVGFAPKQCRCWEGGETTEVLQQWPGVSSVPSHTEWGRKGSELSSSHTQQPQHRTICTSNH